MWVWEWSVQVYIVAITGFRFESSRNQESSSYKVTRCLSKSEVEADAKAELVINNK